jgi:hypothetical protein
MKIKHLLIASIVIIGGLTFSCSKSKLQKKMDGKWKLVDVTKPANDSTSQIDDTYWYFEGNQIVITKDNGVKEDTVDIGSYILKIKLETKEFNTKGFGEKAYKAETELMEYRENFYNDQWKVDKIEDDIFAIYSNKEKNFQYFDFIKVE